MADRIHYLGSLDGGKDVKMIGVYSSREKAEQAIARASQLEGFRDHPDGFVVTPYTLGEDHWTEEFDASHLL